MDSMNDPAQPIAICPARRPGSVGYRWSTEAACVRCALPLWLSDSMREMHADPVCFSCAAGFFAAEGLELEPEPASEFYKQGHTLGFSDDEIEAILADMKRKLKLGWKEWIGRAIRDAGR